METIRGEKLPVFATLRPLTRTNNTPAAAVKVRELTHRERSTDTSQNMDTIATTTGKQRNVDESPSRRRGSLSARRDQAAPGIMEASRTTKRMSL